MTIEMGLTFGVILVALVAMAGEWMAPDFILTGALGILVAAGVVDLERALDGFADPTLLALGSLFVVASGLQRTGVLRKIAQLVFGESTRLGGILLRLTATVASSSAFLNNTPIVAMGIPAVLAWARDHDIAPSSLLIPLSYASIMGGLCTLIGTSTNLVADGVLRSHGYAGFGFFELAAVGLPMTLVGILYLCLASPRLLHERAHLETALLKGTVARDIHLVSIPGDSPAAGRRVADLDCVGSRLQLMRIVRADGTVIEVKPDARLRAGDRLTFRGDSRIMSEAADGLGLEGIEVEELPDFADDGDLREAVIAQGSELVGDRIVKEEFRDRYDAVILGLVRNGKQVEDVESLTLRPGDVLLLVARPEFARNYTDSHHFHLLTGEEGTEADRSEAAEWSPRSAYAGLAILGGIVALATAGVVHISVAALGGAILMGAFRFLTPSQARRSVDWSVLIVIGAAIGLGSALENSGGAALVAGWIADAGAPFGPHGILAALLVATMLFTLTITNNAAVAIVIPVAIAVGSDRGLDIRPLVVTVTLGASLAFATPLGYQTNLMVYGPGGYRFGDFVRAGLPLQILLAVVAILLIPIVWPL